ncbi:hypothetical protein [Cerasicoccus frondis]|uniref:hypothetical protein n=1 Tax=Cerasicoccus frondis TaxID=490090 RepID=UPI0028528998|nr:hypothetical protein [Cerasicoccus frondis]
MNTTPAKHAVLLIAFNRPGPTRRVLQAICEYAPPRLYIACDGPRPGNSSDEEQVSAVREAALKCGINCELRTRFRTENFGVGRGPADAIDWFFKHEACGVILEDDCLPSPDFFRFCNWALETYRDDQRVWHVSGSNFAAPPELYQGHTAAFHSLPQVWGWATWRDRWSRFTINPFQLEAHMDEAIHNWRLSWVERQIKRYHLAVLKDYLYTWDYQWQITVLNAGGLVVSCVANLVTNIGEGVGATHTQDDDRIGIPAETCPATFAASEPLDNPALTRHYARHMTLQLPGKALKLCLLETWRNGWNMLRNLLRRIVFPHQKKIVIASNGRAGSTLLYHALSEAYARKHRPLLCRLGLGQLLAKLSRDACIRLAKLTDSPAPVLKTHDLFPHGDPTNAAYVFVYCDPLESAISVERRTERDGVSWFLEHQYNLHGAGPFEKLFEEDILAYRQQMESWSQAGSAVMCIDYDQMWELEEAISRHTGLPLTLPARQPRTSQLSPNAAINQELFDELRRVADSTMPSKPVVTLDD